MFKLKLQQPESERKRTVSLLVAVDCNKRQLTFLSICGNLGLIPRWLFPRSSERENSQVPQNPRSLRFSFTYELSILLPTANPPDQCLLLAYSASAVPTPELGSLYLLPPPLSTANVDSFREAHIFLPNTWCIKMLAKLQDQGQVVSSTEPCCCWFRLRAPTLVFFC